MKELNWLDKHEYLKKEGFDFPRKNLALLMATNGDADKVLEKYLRKADKKTGGNEIAKL